MILGDLIGEVLRRLSLVVHWLDELGSLFLKDVWQNRNMLLLVFRRLLLLLLFLNQVSVVQMVWTGTRPHLADNFPILYS